MAVKAFPMWMAPNVITLAGFGFIVAKCVPSLPATKFLRTDALSTSIATLALFLPDLVGRGTCATCGAEGIGFASGKCYSILLVPDRH